MAHDVVHVGVHGGHKVVDIAHILAARCRSGEHIGHDLGHMVAGGEHAVDGDQHIALRVKTLHQTRHLPTEGRTLRRTHLGNFVAEGVHHDGGMVESAAHHGRYILAPPVLHHKGVIVILLGARPHIEGLVHHIQAQLVAGTQQCRRSGIVGHADGIEASLLQNTDTAQFRLVEADGAQQAVIVVDAGTAELHALAVHLQSAAAVQTHGTDTKGGLGSVLLLPVVGEGHGAAIEVGGLGAPQLRRRNGQSGTKDFSAVASHGDGNGHSGHFLVAMEDLRRQMAAEGTEIAVLQLYRHRQRGIVLLHILGAYLHALILNVDRGGF